MQGEITEMENLSHLKIAPRNKYITCKLTIKLIYVWRIGDRGNVGTMRQKKSFSLLTKVINKIQNIFTLLKYRLYCPHHIILKFSSRHCIKRKNENIKNDILSLCSPTLGTFETQQKNWK